jgi:hypothetical protein
LTPIAYIISTYRRDAKGDSTTRTLIGTEHYLVFEPHNHIYHPRSPP